jgi:diacylglycerol kinase family enzyme
MKFTVILNRGGGTLRSLDLDAFCQELRETLEAAGHSVEMETVDGEGLIEALERARDSDCDVVMAGGGDGTISAAAATMRGSDKALAILPAGTMNLFARSLEIPLSLSEAVEAHAEGRIVPVDLASANGRVFIHQFSLGMHPRLIHLREKRSFGSRLGKMRASMQAAAELIFRPSRIAIELDVDGEVQIVRTHSLGVTNNLFGEGHLPYAEKPDGGVLGVYLSKSRRRADFVRFLANLAIGRWQANPQVDIMTARQVVIRTGKESARFGCSIDGELEEAEHETVIQIHPGALKVVVPAVEEAAGT